MPTHSRVANELADSWVARPPCDEVALPITSSRAFEADDDSVATYAVREASLVNSPAASAYRTISDRVLKPNFSRIRI